MSQAGGEGERVMTAGMWFGSFSAVKSVAVVTTCEPCVLVFLNRTDVEIASSSTQGYMSQPSCEFNAVSLQSLSFGPRRIGEGAYGEV